MGIPTYINETHIVKAVGRIIRGGIPATRRSRRYCLVTTGHHLPPKFTISVAHQVAKGDQLHPDEFSGGAESNEFLRQRGFEVVECDCGGRARDGRRRKVRARP